MVRTKVFVGNLDFSTKEAELVTQFGTAGKVISANIITRGPRSLGYGFVEMESEEDAAKAVQAMNKKEIDGRPINVEVAKIRDETAEKNQEDQRGANAGRGRGGFKPRGERGGGRGGAPRGAPRGTRGSPRGERGSPSRGRGTFRPRGERPANEEGTVQKEAEDRAPSKTTLFIANLPFKMDDDAFAKVFKDAGLALKSAHVVKNQRSGRSKGFGFAEFDNESDQQKALNALNKKSVDERELIVKVALTENKPAEQQPQKS
jgi:RNA recognition motif-containing protein